MIFHSSQDDKFKQEIVQSFYNLNEVIKEKICSQGQEMKIMYAWTFIIQDHVSWVRIAIRIHTELGY